MPPSPLTVTLIQSTILNALSNIIAQVIDRHKENKPFTLNTIALIQFVAYAIIIVPINFSWQRYVEATFPGFPSWRNPDPSSSASGSTSGNVALVAPSTPDDLLPRKEKPSRPRPRSGMWNFGMKFLLDQTVGSVMNIVLFIVLINLLKGMSWATVYRLTCEDFGPIMIARLKYRPLVSVLMYTVVPVDRRVVFGSACGVVWGVYLSLYAAV
ncbi:predicted protein [Aspergillus terreus NIH2624]|uniref:Mpv17/PMP22 family protein n=1 Tax=Aspergillus terreus (strain NIH 2624 / FGSC A1156) TaxID=341663 RepID=Q0CGG5_ASPTN|nr:uncharacterized protein ATEG_07227 [Aspergillus terreus NIH2624]EAU32611.1 predicted protein [Aspergillus terreus NIH2624]